MKLARLQNAFQAGVLLGDSAISRSILDSRRLDRAARFKIYFDAYRFRLAEFLSNDYPVLRSFLGDELFGLLVEAYVEAMPSHYPNARDYGGRLPNFMRLTGPWGGGRDAIDLARLERALSAAFDAADGPDWLSAVLPIFRLRIGLIWRSASIPAWLCSMSRRGPSSGMPRFPQTQAGSTSSRQDRETILVWRNDGQVFHRTVEAAERLAYLEARRGTTFGDICTLLEFQNADEKITSRVASFLADWFRDGLVSRVSVVV